MTDLTDTIFSFVVTSIQLPPVISRRYARMLLDTPAKMGHDSEALWEVYLYIKHKLLKRANHSPITQARCKLLQEAFLHLYERAKTKEKNKDEASKNKTQIPFYYIQCPDSRDTAIFSRLRYGPARFFSKFRKDYEDE